MKTIFYTLLLIGIAFVSCDKEPDESMEISIKNTTEGKISVKLFPKSEYWQGADLYRPSDSSRDSYTGPFQKQLFELEPMEEKYIFSSENINQQPYSLTTMAFDSIHIILQDEQEIIRFSMDKAIGYQDNLFIISSSWDYEVVNTVENYQFSSNSIEIHKHNFVISTDKITK